MKHSTQYKGFNCFLKTQRPLLRTKAFEKFNEKLRKAVGLIHKEDNPLNKSLSTILSKRKGDCKQIFCFVLGKNYIGGHISLKTLISLNGWHLWFDWTWLKIKFVAQEIWELENGPKKHSHFTKPKLTIIQYHSLLKHLKEKKRNGS